jgi:hypothetical protein
VPDKRCAVESDQFAQADSTKPPIVDCNERRPEVAEIAYQLTTEADTLDNAEPPKARLGRSPGVLHVDEYLVCEQLTTRGDTLRPVVRMLSIQKTPSAVIEEKIMS